MDEIFEIIGAIITFFVVIMSVSFVMALPVMWLWNWLIPEMFGLTELTYWKSWGVFMLSGLLSKGVSFK